jgi:hypothetical protein
VVFYRFEVPLGPRKRRVSSGRRHLPLPILWNRIRAEMKIVILLFLVIMVSGCSALFPTQEEEDIRIIPVEEPEGLPDDRFSGAFSYSNYVDWDNYRVSTYTFEGTIKVSYYGSYAYWNDYGWHHSGDYVGDYNSWYYEFQILNGQYRERLWDIPNAEWSLWHDYSFSADGSVLTLYHGITADFTYSMDYIKQ